MAHLTPQERQDYKAGYCGLCQSLRQESGRLSTLTLNYEFTFLAHLEAAHSHEATPPRSVSCTAVPWKKVDALTIDPKIGALGLVMAGLKLEDDQRDEGSVKARLGRCFLEPKVARALKTLKSADFPIAAIQRYSDDQLHAEQRLAGGGSIDRIERLSEAAAPSGRFSETVFDWLSQAWTLSPTEVTKWPKLGRLLGEAVYIVDALEDRVRDAKSGSFNVLSDLAAGEREPLQTELAARARSLMTLWSELPRRTDAWPGLTSSLEQLCQRLTPPLVGPTEVTDTRLHGMRKRQARAAFLRLNFRNEFVCVDMLFSAISELCWCAGVSRREREMERVHGDILQDPGHFEAPKELERIPFFGTGDYACPSCGGKPMNRQVIGQAGLFHCSRCSGVWLSGFHLPELRRHKETKNFNTFPQDSVPPVHPPGTRLCPVDGETLDLSREQGVTVEVCPTCQGWYLDAGELGSLL